MRARTSCVASRISATVAGRAPLLRSHAANENMLEAIDLLQYALSRIRSRPSQIPSRLPSRRRIHVARM